MASSVEQIVDFEKIMCNLQFNWTFKINRKSIKYILIMAVELKF